MDQEIFRAIVGKIGWISISCRLDVLFEEKVISRKLGKGMLKYAIEMVKK